MYNTKIICTYNTPEIFLETDEITDNERNFIRNVIYRQELLDILGMDEYNEDEMKIIIKQVYELLKGCQELRKCMLKVSKKFISKDEELGLMILFSYDYMYLTHKCISEFIETGHFTQQNIRELESIILGQ